jgi:hypothetical protein
MRALPDSWPRTFLREDEVSRFFAALEKEPELMQGYRPSRMAYFVDEERQAGSGHGQVP